MKFALLTPMFALTLMAAFGQNTTRGTVTTAIKDNRQNGLENATIELLAVKDSSLIKTALTDKAGAAILENVPLKTYLLKVSMVNYAVYYSSSFSLTPEQPRLNLAEIILVPKTGIIFNWRVSTTVT